MAHAERSIVVWKQRGGRVLFGIKDRDGNKRPRWAMFKRGVYDYEIDRMVVGYCFAFSNVSQVLFIRIPRNQAWITRR
jgi:hypothetical protein